ncbi:MAG: VTT domain-containing protein [Polyangiaceae bacterium]
MPAADAPAAGPAEGVSAAGVASADGLGAAAFPARPRAPRWLRPVLVVVVLAALLAAWRTGLLGVVTDAERLRDALRALGGWGHAAYVAVFTLFQPFGIPGAALIVGAIYVWPPFEAYILSWLGAMGSSTVGFLFARFVGREWIAQRIPARFRAWDARIEKNGIWAAVLMRLVFWMNPFVHGLFGLSRISFTHYMIGCAIGYVPTIAAIVWLGGHVVEAVAEQPSRLLPWLGGVVALIVAWRLWAWRRKRRAQPG